MFSDAAPPNYPKIGMIGSVQCHYNTSCIVSDQACQCDGASHGCRCNSKTAVDGGTPLPYSDGPYTVYKDTSNDFEGDIHIKDDSGESVVIGITTLEKETPLYTNDECEIVSLKAVGCFGCNQNAKVKVHYKSLHDTVSVQCGGTPIMVQSSPADISVHVYATSQEIQCTLFCGSFAHNFTTTARFQYSPPVPHHDWVEVEESNVVQNINGPSPTSSESLLHFILKNWKTIIIVVILFIAAIIILKAFYLITRLISSLLR